MWEDGDFHIETLSHHRVLATGGWRDCKTMYPCLPCFSDYYSECMKGSVLACSSIMSACVMLESVFPSSVS